MQRLLGVQRLRGRRLQVLQSLRGLRRVQLRLLHLVGRLPVHLQARTSAPTKRSFTRLLLLCASACGRGGSELIAFRGAEDARPFPMRSIEDNGPNAATTLEARWV